MYPNEKTPLLTKPIKILLMLVLVLIVVFFGVGFIKERFYEGNIEVITSLKGAKISATTLSSFGSNAQTYSLINKTTIPLNATSYIVSVVGQNGSAERTVTLHPGSTKTITINPLNTLPDNPVTSLNSPYFGVGNSYIDYLGGNSTKLIQINSQNQISLLSSIGFSSFKWGGSGVGVAQSKNNSLYLINNASVSQIPTDNISLSPFSSYSVSSSGKIYFTSGNIVYSYSPEAGVKRFFNTSSSNVTVFAGNDGVLVADGSKNHTSINLINNSGVTQSSASISSYSYALSPNNDLVASSADPLGKIYNSKLKAIATIPNINPSDLEWLNNNTLLYVSGFGVWSYNVKSASSILLINTGKRAVVSLELGPSKNNIYLSLEGTGTSKTTSSILKYSLKNQPVSLLALKLYRHLPWLVTSCLYDFINLSSPALVVRSFYSNVSQCAGLTQPLSQFGINTTNMPIYFSNIQATSL